MGWVQAKQVAAAIQKERNIGPGAKAESQAAAEAVMKGESGGAGLPGVSGKSIAHQIANAINDKLGYVAEEKEELEEQVIETVVEEELEINDFPQPVRWRVCSRETLGLVQEYSDVFISVRGVFIPPGKKLPKAAEGQPGGEPKKLHLYIESKTEIGLNRAKQEIIRVLREELKRLASHGGRQAPQGRYKVL